MSYRPGMKFMAPSRMLQENIIVQVAP